MRESVCISSQRPGGNFGTFRSLTSGHAFSGSHLTSQVVLSESLHSAGSSFTSKHRASRLSLSLSLSMLTFRVISLISWPEAPYASDSQSTPTTHSISSCLLSISTLNVSDTPQLNPSELLIPPTGSYLPQSSPSDKYSLQLLRPKILKSPLTLSHIPYPPHNQILSVQLFRTCQNMAPACHVHCHGCGQAYIISYLGPPIDI